MNVNYFLYLFVNLFVMVVCTDPIKPIDQSNTSSTPSPLTFKDNKTEVISTSVIFRHGDRTPICPYPNDPYNDASYWPVAFGHLTPTGMEQERQLGEWLRSKYSHLLSDYYDPSEIYVMSTSTKRVQHSAQYCLYGLYPKRVTNHNKLRISVIAMEHDNILGVRRRCPKYEDEFRKVLQSEEIREFDRANSQLYAFLTEHSGQRVTSLTDVACVYDALYVQKLHNKTLPGWSNQISLKALESLTIIRAMAMVNSTEMKRLKSGLLLKDIINHAIAKANDESGVERNMWMYSGHDDTIMNMLMALGVFEPHCPTYAALIGIELRRNEKQNHFVTIFYKESDEEPVYFKLKDCDLKCPLNEFQRLMKPLILEDWDKECAS